MGMKEAFSLLKEKSSECGRASEAKRVKLIDAGREYSNGSGGRLTDAPSALACFVLAEFEDTAYYNEFGKDPLSAAASKYLNVSEDALFNRMGSLEELFYRKVMAMMYEYLELRYYKQPHCFIVKACIRLHNITKHHV